MDLDELEFKHPKYLLTTLSMGIILELYILFSSKISIILNLIFIDFSGFINSFNFILYPSGNIYSP